LCFVSFFHAAPLVVSHACAGVFLRGMEKVCRAVVCFSLVFAFSSFSFGIPRICPSLLSACSRALFMEGYLVLDWMISRVFPSTCVIALLLCVLFSFSLITNLACVYIGSSMLRRPVSLTLSRSGVRLLGQIQVFANETVSASHRVFSCLQTGYRWSLFKASSPYSGCVGWLGIGNSVNQHSNANAIS
jgi:hypothetical protein